MIDMPVLCDSTVGLVSAGYGDLNFLNVHDGGDELLSAVQLRARPKFHVFGHIHEGTQDDIANTLSHDLYSVS